MTVNFVLSTWGDSHQLNRALSLEEEGATVNLYAYDRDYYPSAVDRNYTKIGQLKNAKYFGRLWIYLKAVFLFRKQLITSNVTYIFGLDNLIVFYLSTFFKRKSAKIVLEITDIRDIQTNQGFVGKCLRFIEKRALRKIDLLVVTSEAYISEYYDKVLSLKSIPHFVMENKIHKSAENIEGKKLEKLKRKGDLTIGYFGLLRCERTLNLLIQLAKKLPEVNIVLRGRFMPETVHLKDAIEDVANIFFFGPYQSPMNLAEMYSEIDISWIAYPHTEKLGGNWRWAKTNRYYEAGFYKTAMITGEGMQSASIVNENKIGLVLDLFDFEDSLNKLSILDKSKIQVWKSNLSLLPINLFEVTDDYPKLLQRITSH